MTRALLWKDLRLASPALAAAGVFVVVCFVSMFLIARTMTPGPFPWVEASVSAAHFCQWSFVIVAALLAGGVFATEREEGSARFVAGLPVFAHHIVLSKVIVVLLVFELLWIAIAMFMHAAVPMGAMNARAQLPGAGHVSSIAAVAFCALGLTSLATSRIEKPVAAASLGVLATGAFLVGTPTLFGSETNSLDVAAPWIAGAGALAFAAAILLYIRAQHYPLDTRKKPMWRAKRKQSLDQGSPPVQITGAAQVPMRSLLWKDGRIVSPIVWGGLAMLALPYLYPLVSDGTRLSPMELYARATMQSIWLSCVVFAVWGGYSVAVERAARTDTFLRALAISPILLARSRLLTTFVPALSVFVANISATLILHALIFRESPVEETTTGFFQMTWPLLVWQPNSLIFTVPTFGMPLVCYGVAWYASTVLDRPFLGIGLGVCAPGAVLVAWLSFIGIVEESMLPMNAAMLFLALGAITAWMLVFMGSRRYVRFDG